MLHASISDNDINLAIVELLKTNNRVIIPNFGAFILSPTTSEKILFNSFLSFNDGLLIGYLSDKMSLIKSDVMIEVNNYVELLRTSLDAKGQILLKGLGTLSKDHNQAIHFNKDELNTSQFTDEPLTITAPYKKELLDIDLAPNMEASTTIEEPQLPQSTTPNSKLLTIDSEPEKSDTDLAFEKASKDFTTNNTATNTTNKPSHPNYYQPESISSSDTSEKRKKSLVWFILLFILIPLLAGVYYLGFHQNKFGWLKAKEVPKVEVKAEIKPVEAQAPQPEPKPAPTGIDKGFQIIVATKSSEADAQAYVDKLKSKGFANAFVLAHKGKFLVSIDQGDEWIQTELLQEEIVNKYRIESYLLTIKK